MNITVIGGGNIGTVLLGELAKSPENRVSLLTSRPEQWHRTIEVIDSDAHTSFTAELTKITSDAAVVQGAELIFITVPSNALPKTVTRILPYVQSGTVICIVPGSGGCEFVCRPLIEKGCVFCGLQRVHCIARVKEYGKSVYALSHKSEISVAAIPQAKTPAVADMLGRLLHMPCKALCNYLAVTLTPSNPILHTARLYAMFRDYKAGVFYPRNLLFYAEWDALSSETLIQCDAELQRLCNTLPLELSEVVSLKIHYESDTVEKMTHKISHIPAFQGILSPMCETPDGFVPDFTSRYFLEDFPYGLCIIKSFCQIANVECPTIDRVLHWYEAFMGVHYFTESGFDGADLKGLPLPQNFGFKSAQEIAEYYTK